MRSRAKAAREQGEEDDETDIAVHPEPPEAVGAVVEIQGAQLAEQHEPDRGEGDEPEGAGAGERHGQRQQRHHRREEAVEPRQRVVAEQRSGFVATVDEDGTPNLSPKGTMIVLDDDRIVLGEIP